MATWWSQEKENERWRWWRRSLGGLVVGMDVYRLYCSYIDRGFMRTHQTAPSSHIAGPLATTYSYQKTNEDT